MAVEHTGSEHTSKHPGRFPAFDVTNHMPFPLDQYLAVRQTSGVFDRSQRGRMALRGADRLGFLHALLTNDVAGLGAGRGCYAAFLTPQGRMIADLRVFELGDTVLLDVHRGTTDALLARFDQMLFSEDVQIGDVSGSFGCVSVQGPLSTGVVGAVSHIDPQVLGAWEPYRNARADWRGETIIVARADEFAMPGFLVFAPMPVVPDLAATIGAAGAAAVDAEVEEALRIEAGVPAFLVDMDTETIPLEAGLETTAVSYAKGCFPGQEVLVRIRDRGHGRVARRLVGLAISGTVVPARGALVRSEDKDTGVVTSAAWSPVLGGPLALAYVRRELAEPGCAVTVVVGDAWADARVVRLPVGRD